MRDNEHSAVAAAAVILAGAVASGVAMWVQADLSGIARILVLGLGLALPAFCGVKARRLVMGSGSGGSRGSKK